MSEENREVTALLRILLDANRAVLARGDNLPTMESMMKSRDEGMNEEYTLARNVFEERKSLRFRFNMHGLT